MWLLWCIQPREMTLMDGYGSSISDGLTAFAQSAIDRWGSLLVRLELDVATTHGRLLYMATGSSVPSWLPLSTPSQCPARTRGVEVQCITFLQGPRKATPPCLALLPRRPSRHSHDQMITIIVTTRFTTQ